MSEMSHEDAFAALSEAAAQDAAAEQVVASPASPTAPAEQAGAPVEANVQPEGQAPAPVEPPAAGAQQPAEPVVPFNPDELPEELLPAWRQMQAAFTPRLQQAAAITKRFEELGGEEAVQQAIDLYERVGNPEHWPRLYEELYQAMEQAGFEFEDPALPGAPAVPASPFGQLTADDPDLAPLVSELQALRGRTDEQQMLIEQFYQEQELRQQMADEELRQAQHLANLQRQVMSIRQANPSYNEEDVKAIIELGSFYGDDLPLAQQRYEAIIASRLNRYFESKKTATPPSTQPVSGAGVLSTTDEQPSTLEDAEAEAVELMRRLQAAGEIDFS